MIASSTTLLIAVIALASLLLAATGFIRWKGKRQGTGLIPGTREPGAFLAGVRTNRRSKIGAWYLPLASVGVQARSTRSSREASRSSFSPTFDQNQLCLPALNDSAHSRRFWAALATPKPGRSPGDRKPGPSQMRNS